MSPIGERPWTFRLLLWSIAVATLFAGNELRGECAPPDTHGTSSPQSTKRGGRRWGVDIDGSQSDCGPASMVAVARSQGVAMPNDDMESILAVRHILGAPGDGPVPTALIASGVRSLGLDTVELWPGSVAQLAMAVDCGCSAVLVLAVEGSDIAHAVAVTGHRIRGRREVWRVFDVGSPTAHWLGSESIERRSPGGVWAVGACRSWARPCTSKLCQATTCSHADRTDD